MTRELPRARAPEPHAAPVQRKADRPSDDAANVQAAAARGVASGGGALPHLSAIQHSFGRHDVSSVQAHVGGAASEANAAMGAEAYASGSRVAFRQAPSLHTAAHEAAHIVQQRKGVSLGAGGVGKAGDSYEQHADKVADAVVAGRSAESLLDTHAPDGEGGRAQSAPQSGVQQRVVQREEVSVPVADGTYGWTAKYTATFDEPSKECRVFIKCSLTPKDATVTADQIASIQSSTAAQFAKYWDNKFTVTDKGTGTKYRMRVSLAFVTSGAHVAVTVHPGTGRPDLTNWYVQERNNVDLAHELGHQMGLKDEYIDSKSPNRATATSPGVSNDHSIMGDYNKQGQDQAEAKPRHGEEIAKGIGGATGKNLESGTVEADRLAAVTRQRAAIKVAKDAASAAAAWHNGAKSRGETVAPPAEAKAGQGWTKWALAGQKEKEFDVVAAKTGGLPEEVDAAAAAVIQLYNDAKTEFDAGKALVGAK